MYLSNLLNHAENLFFISYSAGFTSFNTYLYFATEP